MPWTTVVPHEKSNYSNFAPADQTREFLMKATSNMDKPLSIVHIGDLSYAVGYAVFWEYFMSRQISPIAARVPYMVGIGNHEYDWPTQPFDPSWANYALDSGGEVRANICSSDPITEVNTRLIMNCSVVFHTLKDFICLDQEMQRLETCIILLTGAQSTTLLCPPKRISWSLRHSMSGSK